MTVGAAGATTGCCYITGAATCGIVAAVEIAGATDATVGAAIAAAAGWATTAPVVGSIVAVTAAVGESAGTSTTDC